MLKVNRVLGATLLTLIVSTSAALAQHGPWVQSTPVQTPATPAHQEPIPEPIIDLVPAPSIKTVPLTTESKPSAPPNSSKPLGLPRTTTQDQPLGNNDVKTPIVLGKDFARTLATLAGVLLLIFALAHFYKRLVRSKGGLSGQIGAGGRAPSGLVEVLGRYPISSGMTLVVLRFDRKVLLLSHAGGGRGKKGFASSGTMHTLCEMDNPEDVASILTKVRDASGDSIAASFERTLQEAGNATDNEIAKAMYQPAPGVHVQRPRRVAPGFVSTNDEGDRLELTSMHDSPAAAQVLRRRLGAMRRER